MKTAALAAAAVIGLFAAVVSAAELPALEQAYSGLSQIVKPQAAALAKSAKAAAVKRAARSERVFELEFERGRWHLRPDPNPPGSGLLIDVEQGDHVRLELTNMSWRGGQAEFLIDGLEATVDGRPTRNVEVWLDAPGQTAVVEFDANKPGFYAINRSFSAGRLLIRGK